MLKNYPHPGELLREEVLIPLGFEVTEAANRLGVVSRDRVLTFTFKLAIFA